MLGRERNGAGAGSKEGGAGGGLPVHLAGVEAMMEVVELVKEGNFGL